MAAEERDWVELERGWGTLVVEAQSMTSRGSRIEGGASGLEGGEAFGPDSVPEWVGLLLVGRRRTRVSAAAELWEVGRVAAEVVAGALTSSPHNRGARMGTETLFLCEVKS